MSADLFSVSLSKFLNLLRFYALFIAFNVFNLKIYVNRVFSCKLRASLLASIDLLGFFRAFHSIPSPKWNLMICQHFAKTVFLKIRLFTFKFYRLTVLNNRIQHIRFMKRWFGRVRISIEYVDQVSSLKRVDFVLVRWWFDNFEFLMII